MRECTTDIGTAELWEKGNRKWVSTVGFWAEICNVNNRKESVGHSSSSSSPWSESSSCPQGLSLLASSYPHSLKKVKCTLVQALRLCTARRGSRGIALTFHDHGTRRGWGVRAKPWPLFTTGKDPVLIVQELGWAPGLVCTGAENLAPTGIRSPDRPAHSQFLYRLR